MGKADVDLQAALEDARAELAIADLRVTGLRAEVVRVRERALDAERALHVALGLPPVPVTL